MSSAIFASLSIIHTDTRPHQLFISRGIIFFLDYLGVFENVQSTIKLLLSTIGLAALELSCNLGIFASASNFKNNAIAT